MEWRLVGRLFGDHRTPQEALLCAKAKRQHLSAQSEQKSITRYGDGPVLVYF
ncbi:hypothetical protein ACPCXF_24415 [Lysinibacillus agricola]